jgi:nicotinamide-nucleotide amidase
VDARVQPIYGPWLKAPNPISTTILSVPGQIELHLSAQAKSVEEADALLSPAVEELRRALGDIVFSVDGRQIEEVVGELLRHRHMRVAIAESCTGGLLTSRLTDVPGSSDYVERGIVCYSNQAKMDVLGIPESLIAKHGAVSDGVARAMAEAVAVQAKADVGIGVTGIAGPGGGTAEKPVGTVVIAVTVRGVTEGRTFQFPGGRELVRNQAVSAALNMLRVKLQ